METDVGVQFALVDIWGRANLSERCLLGGPTGVVLAGGRSSLTDAGPHVHGGHEAVEAKAAVLPRDVGALPTVADVRRVLALIDVCERQGVT